MSDKERNRGKKEKRESPSQVAWRMLYSNISADANARNLPADRLRYRQEIDYKGFNETRSNYEVRVACYGVDDVGRPRVVVADVYEDDIQIQQVFSEAIWNQEGLGISLVPSKTDKSYARLSLVEIGTYAGGIVQGSILESAIEEPRLENEETSQGQTIFPVPLPKVDDLPN